MYADLSLIADLCLPPQFLRVPMPSAGAAPRNMTAPMTTIRPQLSNAPVPSMGNFAPGAYREERLSVISDNGSGLTTVYDGSGTNGFPDPSYTVVKPEPLSEIHQGPPLLRDMPQAFRSWSSTLGAFETVEESVVRSVR